MSRVAIAFGCTAALLAGCGGSGEPAREAASRSAAVLEATRGQASGASQPGDQARLKRLDTPLPGGVVPAFEHHTLVDMSTRAHVTIRQVHLDLPTLTAREGIAALVGQFEAAGLSVGEPGEEGGTLVQGVWTPSADGARGMAVVDAGGTYVVLMGTDYEPGHSRHDDGFVAMLRIQVNSK